MKKFLALLGLALAATHAAGAGWSRPGEDRYIGDVPAAVQHYRDIPPDTRARLQSRMERHAYDDRVTITRDAIISAGDGDYVYAPQITDMHFGAKGRILPVAGREDWPAELKIEALAYTEGDYTIIVPAVCSNVARAVRLPPKPVAFAPIPEYVDGGGGGPLGYVPFLMPPLSPPTQTTTVTYVPTIPNLVPTIPNLVPWYPPPVPCCGAPWIPPIKPPVPPVPEPAAWLLMLAGLAVIAWRKAT